MESAPLFDCAGRRRSPADVVGVPPGTAAAQQGIALSARSTDGRGDHCRDACRWRDAGWPETPGPRRGALARGITSQRSARVGRERSRRSARCHLGPPRQRRQATRSRDGPLGLGPTLARLKAEVQSGAPQSALPAGNTGTGDHAEAQQPATRDDEAPPPG
jgi:hypothetical protein